MDLARLRAPAFRVQYKDMDGLSVRANLLLFKMDKFRYVLGVCALSNGVLHAKLLGACEHH